MSRSGAGLKIRISLVADVCAAVLGPPAKPFRVWVAGIAVEAKD